MRRRTVAGLLSFGLLAATGACDRAAAPRPSVQADRAVVVDLDVVARAIGRDETIRQQVEAATRSLNAQLLQAAQDMQKQLDAEKARLGEGPTEEGQARLRELTGRAHQNVRTNKLLAQMRQQEIRKELIDRFREELRPIAERIAGRYDASVVLVSTDNLLWFAPRADITDEVIGELRARDLSTADTPSGPVLKAGASRPSTTPKPAPSSPPGESDAASPPDESAPREADTGGTKPE